MKLFTMLKMDEAVAFAKSGGQALHVHTFTTGGHPFFARYAEAGHLFDQDLERLAATARMLGVRVVKIERRRTLSQHVDLCARPLRRAKQLCIYGNGDNQ